MLLSILVILPQAWKTDSVEVILHRSASMVAPENTVPALEAAVRQGADGVEIDVRKTLDGHLVLYHDDWLPDTYGPGAKIEDLTLAEVLALDVGSRWGSRWKGLRAPMVRDVFAFSKANQLKLFLDIKTPKIDDDLNALINAKGVRSLVIVPDRLTAPGNRAIPWVQGWNYLEGGEEDMGRMKQVAEIARSKPTRVMADDARALISALGRKPQLRPFVPFRAGPRPASPAIASNWLGTSSELRRSLWKQAVRPDRSEWSRVRVLARTAKAPSIRLDAIFALGTSHEPQDLGTLIDVAGERLAEDPANHPSGMPYFDTFRLAAVACALARNGSPRAQQELREMAARRDFSSTAAVLAATIFRRDRLALDLLDQAPNESGLTFALSYAGAHPLGRDLYRRGLQSKGYERRISVFGLAQLARANRRVVEALLKDDQEKVRSGTELALFWADK